MTKSVYHQSSFLGGEWGPRSQGRSELPAYHQAMKVCLNGIIAEEGAWVRRSGFQFLAPSHLGNVVKLLPYVSDVATPYLMEFTDSYLRFFSGTSILFTPEQPVITASSLASGILSLTVSDGTNFVVGDDCMIYAPANSDYAAIGPWQGRIMQVHTVSSNDITCVDAFGAVFVGLTSAADALVDCFLFRVAHLATSWAESDLSNLRVVQAIFPNETMPKSIVLSASVAPQVVTIDTPPIGNIDAIFSIAAVAFVDGPYLDPQGTLITPETGTVSAYTGTITFTPATTVFTTADVGRHIRLFSQPPAWAVGTTYTDGDTVTDAAGAWWEYTYSSDLAGVVPGTSTTISTIPVFPWAPLATAGQWAWGKISAQAGASCTVILTTDLNSTNGVTISRWQLGVFHIAGADASGNIIPACFPTDGLYYEGRLLLAGAVPNRLDTSMSNDVLTFSPTDIYDNVLDSSGISAILNAETQNTIYWLAPDHLGILMGTLGGEWLIQASTLGDPLTPTSIQIHKITSYGCANIEPKRVGMALTFVQRYKQRVMEYLSDTFSGRFIGKHLNEFAKHLAETGIEEIVYQEEIAPVLWARMGSGLLVGCTYRRMSHFVTEAPVFQAWHRHVLGGDYAADIQWPVTSMTVLSNSDGLSDLLYVAVKNNNNYYIEVLRPLFGVG